ncbi:MAG: hypothetical protein QGH74_02685 [Candidatus Brocadiia bacterium]|jgi:Spy/CpxP family protein refolding chaperone|nr:hypothetical protein [Candidatus Brocadiia bacterium]
MRSNKWMSVVLIFSLSLNFGFMGVWAYHFFYVRPLVRERRGRRGPRPRPGGPAFADLRLREEQRRRLEAHREATRPQLTKLRAEADLAQEHYLEALSQPDADPQAEQEALEGAVSSQASFRREELRSLKALHDMLDEEQRRALRRVLRRRRGRGPRGRPHGSGWRRRRPPMQKHRPSRDPEGAAPRPPESL